MTDALTVYAQDPATAGAVEVYKRMDPVRSVIAKDLTDQELTLFALVCDRSGLDPFARQVYAIKRAGRVTFQTGIDGYRSIAGRTGQFEGSSDPEFGPWVDKPFPHPEWCRIVVYRWQNGRQIEQPGTAWWDEYYPGEKGTVPSGPAAVGYMWLTKPRVMLSKVAEAIALRKAFPYLLADIYVREEMEAAGPAEHTAAASAAAQPDPRSRLAARRAALEAKPAQDAPQADVEEAVVREATPDPVASPDPSVCGSVAPDGLMAGAVCTLEPHDHGAHKNADGSWPR